MKTAALFIIKMNLKICDLTAMLSKKSSGHQLDLQPGSCTMVLTFILSHDSLGAGHLDNVTFDNDGKHSIPHGPGS